MKLFTMGNGEVLDFLIQRAGMPLQGLEVSAGLITGVLLPARKVNPHPLVGQGAAGLVVLAFVALLLLVVVALGPRFFLEGESRIFRESLPTEFGTTVTDMNRFRVATLHHDWCNAIELRHIVGGFEPLPVSRLGF